MLSAFTTWELSFELISGSEGVKQCKEYFLILCAFFDTLSISEEYFESYIKEEESKENWTAILKNRAS